jgi:hypothetical protein
MLQIARLGQNLWYLIDQKSQNDIDQMHQKKNGGTMN